MSIFRYSPPFKSKQKSLEQFAQNGSPILTENNRGGNFLTKIFELSFYSVMLN